MTNKRLDATDLRLKGSEDIADMVLDAADQIREELEDVYRDILKQGQLEKTKIHRSTN